MRLHAVDQKKFKFVILVYTCIFNFLRRSQKSVSTKKKWKLLIV